MKDPRLQTILDMIISDRKKGFNHPWIDYLIHLEPFTDGEHRLRELNRIHKEVSINRELINIAENYFLTGPRLKEEITNMEVKEETTVEEYLDYAQHGKEINKRLDNYKYCIEKEYDKPICVIASSDEHFGSTGCDYETAIADWRFMRDNDVKLIQNGDLTEQKKEFPKNAFSVLSQVLSPSQQDDFAVKYLKDMKKNIICAVEGNHGSNARSGNEHSMRKCCREAGIQYHEGAALVKITIQGAVYRIYCRHRPLSMSKVSPLMGIRKMASLERADVYIGSHLHQPTYGIDWVLGEMRVCILTGTLNTDALYSLKGYGEYSARSEFPCLLLFPKTKKIMVFTSMRDAVKYRDMIIGEG